MCAERNEASRRIIPALEALADEAEEWVTQEMYRRYHEQLAPLGIKGRLYIRQDLHYHVDFLTGAIATSTSAYFQGYVRWSAVILKTRGFPTQTLDESLSLLLRFFSTRLELGLFSVVAEMLNAGLNVLAQGAEPIHPLYHAYLPDPEPETKTLADSLVRGEARVARSIATRLRDRSRGYLYIATHLFQPALYEVGLRWQQNQISVAQEHLATAISLKLLTEMSLEAEVAPPSGRVRPASLGLNRMTICLAYGWFPTPSNWPVGRCSSWGRTRPLTRYCLRWRAGVQSS